MSRHTQGPWMVFGGAYRFIVASADHPRKLICDAPDSEPHTEQERANAYLLAAAPELLEALRGMVSLYDNGTAYDSATTITAARAAIAKAEGNAEGV